MELESLADLDPDRAPAPNSSTTLALSSRSGAGRVAPRVAAAPVLLAEQAGERGPVLVGETELFADATVPVLGKCFGHLDAEPMEGQ